MRILLTGATGFLGSALAHHWSRRGHELLLLARPSSNTHRIESLLPQTRLARIDGIMSVPGLFADFAPDAIVHTACSYGRKGETPVDVLDANLRFGTALLQAALQTQDRQVVFLNTGTVLLPDVSLYALSKTQFSQWGASLASQLPSALQFIDIQLQQMYGPGDDRSKFTTHVLETCQNNEARLALTLGEQRRDLIHIYDVVQAYGVILDKHARFTASDAIDVGSGTAVRMRDFVELTKRITQASTELDFGAVPYRTKEAMHCVADITRLSALGWRPTFDLEAGIRQTLNLGTNT